MTFSPDGQFYIRYNYDYGLQIFNFDNRTGEISSRERIFFSDDQRQILNGVAVSPSSQFLYVCTGLYVYQFDLTSTPIENSKVRIADWDGTLNPQSTKFHASALAPDGKIYITSFATTYSLHVIHDPDEKGLACNLEQRGVVLPAPNSSSMANIPHFGPEPDNSPCDSLLMLDRSYDPEYATLSMTIYPNPVLDAITLELDIPMRIESVTISAITGEKLMAKQYASLSTRTMDYDISLLPNGVYFVTLVTKNGSASQKFIKR